MLLTIPAVVSCVVAVLALFVGTAAIALSSGPGWRPLRWFGLAAMCASVYATCALVTTLDVPDSIRPAVARFGGTTIALGLASWFVYFATKQGRKLTRAERWLAGGSAAIAAGWQVPGLYRTSDLFVRHVHWLGASYTTTRPTPLGQVTYVLLVGATLVLAARIFAAWRRRETGALADLIGLIVQLLAGINDALAASGRLDMPYLLDVGQFIVVVAVGTNLISRFISDARALERSSTALRAAQKELVRRERLAALGELSAIVAHEVRNPVTVIFNAVSSLRKQLSTTTGDSRTLLDILDEEAERLKRVVGELLEFARPRDLLVDAVSAKPLVDGAVEAACAGVGGCGELVRVDVEPELPDLEGDEQLLRQALINLITNALQAAGRQGRVLISARAEPRPIDTISFRIEDDGDGVPRDVAERMFTPFFTTRASGTGLGLAIVKRIAEAHAGDVVWEPAASRGAVFTLRVPRVRPKT